MTDERKGLPSASALKRLANCPASWNLSRGIPPEPEGRDADIGHRIHKYLELPIAENRAALLDDEQEIASLCMVQADRLIREWATDVDATEDEYDLILKETRLWLHDQGGEVTEHRATSESGILGKPIFSGQFDEMVKNGNDLLIIDFKTGRGDYEHAADNDQLRALAVMAARRWNLKWVRVAIVQPLAGPPTVADFNVAQLEAGYVWLRQTIAALKLAQPDDANPGAWCQYCPAKLKCDRFLSHTPDAVTAITVGTHKATADSMREVARGLNAETLKWHLDNLRLVGWYVDAVKKEAAARMTAGTEIPGWELRETKGRETVTDVEKVWNQLAPMGCTTEEFARVCTITKKALKPLVKQLSGANGRALDAVMAECTAGATTTGKSSMKLVRIGEADQLEGGE